MKVSSSSSSSSKKKAYSEFPVSGYNVRFPISKQPFPAQLATMSKVLRALHASQNALIESPTGTGKTLALLAASLAFQCEHNRRLKKTPRPNKQVTASSSSSSTTASKTTTTTSTTSTATTNNSTKSTTFVAPVDYPKYNNNNNTSNTSNNNSSSSNTSKSKKPPKPKAQIYFASRTHTQLTQVVQSLQSADTALTWKDHRPNAAILASRRLYCIHERVSTLEPSQQGDACRQLMEVRGCTYHSKATALTTRASKLCDIEELVTKGKEYVGCPYYAAQEMATTSHIVALPYNYLCDPIIRKSMGLDLTNCIVIIDEGHNISDVLRNAASCELTASNINDASKNIILLSKVSRICRDRFVKLSGLIRSLNDFVVWLENNKTQQNTYRSSSSSNNFTSSNSSSSSTYNSNNSNNNSNNSNNKKEDGNVVFNGLQLYRLLKEKCALDESNISDYRLCLDEIVDAQKKNCDTSSSSSSGPQLTSKTISLLDRFLTTCEYIFYGNGLANLQHYKLVLTFVEINSNKSKHQNKNTHRSKNKLGFSSKTKKNTSSTSSSFASSSSSSSSTQYEAKLCIWCTSPSVAFRDIVEPAHSVILASGTLSPLDALAETLGAVFPQRLEAPHCANAEEQLMCSAIGKGRRSQLLGTYKNTSTTRYQDDIGEVLLAHLQHVPGGCLCFISSYSLLNKLVNRWKSSGLWNYLNSKKTCFVEGGGSGGVGETFRNYSKAALQKKGALLLCVFRGRFSEGINFSDELARAVVVVGVPFPSMGDIKLKLIKDSLSGKTKSRFYSTLAYQAVNQAIGRVIRHKDDYGCVLLLDSRYCDESGRRSLSKWVRPHVQVFSGVTESVYYTEQFFIGVNQKNILKLKEKGKNNGQAISDGGNLKVAKVKSFGNKYQSFNDAVKKSNKKKKKKKKKKMKMKVNDDPDSDFEQPVKKKRRKKHQPR